MVWRGAKRIGVVSKEGEAGGLVDILWAPRDGRYRPNTATSAILNPGNGLGRIEFYSTNFGGTYIVIEVIAIECQFRVLITESNYLASESISRF